MNEKPIIFSSDMVRAILDGRKTMTRRPIIPQPSTLGDIYQHPENCYRKDGATLYWRGGGIVKCPYGQVGGRLYVRETIVMSPGAMFYKADDEPCRIENLGWFNNYKKSVCPSIHMPRWASRILLEITDILVERVQDITEEDALAEGIEEIGEAKLHGNIWKMVYKSYDKNIKCCSPSAAFSTLWDSINAKRGYGWDLNPFVWVITFKRLQP